MAQQLKNLAQSTLASNYTAGDSSIAVQSGEGAKFPATGDFTLAFSTSTVDDTPAFFLKCTARSSDTLTVSTTGQEGTTAANTASGVKVTLVITNAVIDGLFADHAGVSSSGTWLTDGTYWYGPLCRTSVDPNVPALAGWTWVNQGGATAADTPGGGIAAWCPDSGSLNWRALMKSAPSTPYHAVFCLRGVAQSSSGGGAQAFGAYFYDGTKLMGLEQITNNASVWFLRVEKITNVNSDNSTAANTPGLTSGGPLFGDFWIRLGNNGTNVTFEWSLDGQSWNLMFSESVGTFITPTHVGIGFISVTGNAAYFVQSTLKAFYLTA